MMKLPGPFVIMLILLVSLFLMAAEYAPKLFTYTTFTQTTTYSVRNMHALTFRLNNAGLMYLNGRGEGWPLDAGTPQDFYPFRNVSTVKFSCTSTAAGSPNKLYAQEM